jgi:hypothetical protein
MVAFLVARVEAANVIGVISVILGVTAKFTDSILWTVTARAYLRFAQTSFLAAVAVGVMATLSLKWHPQPLNLV